MARGHEEADDTSKRERRRGANECEMSEHILVVSLFARSRGKGHARRPAEWVSLQRYKEYRRIRTRCYLLRSKCDSEMVAARLESKQY